MPLNTDVSAIVRAVQSGTAGAAARQANIGYTYGLSLLDGVLANQADRVWSSLARSLAASTNEDLDLAGVLTDPFGATLTFARIKLLLVKAADTNVNNVVVGAAASNTWVGPFGSATHTIAVRPGGCALFVAPDATGWPVTATTADLLRVANSGAGSSVLYDIIALGASA